MPFVTHAAMRTEHDTLNIPIYVENLTCTDYSIFRS